MVATQNMCVAMLEFATKGTATPFSYAGTLDGVELALFTQGSASPPVSPTDDPPNGDVSVAGEVANANAYDRKAMDFDLNATKADTSSISTDAAITFPTATPGAWADGVTLWVGGWAIYDTHVTPGSRQGLWVGAFDIAKPVLANDTVSVALGNLTLQIN